MIILIEKEVCDLKSTISETAIAFASLISDTRSRESIFLLLGKLAEIMIRVSKIGAESRFAHVIAVLVMNAACMVIVYVAHAR